MTTYDYRALCAELITSWDADGCDWKPQHQARWEATVNRARAALAVPEGREPAAVTEQPSDQELLDIAASTIEPYECSGITTDEYEPETECAVEAYGSELIAFARAVLAHWGNPAPAPPADGEVAELVAALRTDAECVAAEQPDLMQLTDKQLTRAADLLECLEQVAYAASDFICGTRFPEFANEHGGIDRLMADLCRLVAQFEHGPRPVPGVDVPGPDGDWGGLAELCNAEGVDLRIGVPLLQRAREAWKYASQAAPVPAEGEVAELVAWLRETGEGQPCLSDEGYARLTRAAELLQRLSPPQPVPVSERLPGPKDCDAIGCCWWYSASHGWELYHRENGLGTSTHWLPAHALPLPEVGE